MSSRPLSLLVTPSEVQSLLDGDIPTVLLDSTWFMPNVQRDPNEEFRQRHIPRAQRWDLDEIAAPHPMGLKHMLPAASLFSEACSKRGITRDTQVIAYDSHGVFSSPRTLFTFKAYGHEKCAILDGGLPRWLSEDRKTESGDPPAAPVSAYNIPGSAKPAASIRDYEAMQSSSSAGQDLILDARPAGRFHGTDPEPRPGLSSGHMPHSVSLPFSRLLTPPSNTVPPYQTLLPKESLRNVLKHVLGSNDALDAALSGQRQVVATCGSGMTAAVIWLALQVLGAKQVSLYDESWTGYAARPESVIEKTT